MKKLTTEEAIENFKKVHGSTYDYSHVSYTTARNFVKIICPIHGEFEQQYHHHLAGRGCKKCGNKAININNGKAFSQEKFIEIITSKNIPNLSFEKVVYKSKREDVIVTCSVHGDYTTKAEILLKGNGCKKCASEKLSSDRLITTDSFVNKAIRKHGNIYDYSNVEYKGSFEVVEIFCKEHQKCFYQTPMTHLKGSGCPLCNTSKGELLISNYLDINKIEYNTQKTFKGLILTRKLKFDFYLPEYNCCIEYDGEQHFKALSNHWGGQEGFIKRQRADRMKNDYCELYNIPLLRIRFDDKNIEESITQFLSKLQK